MKRRELLIRGALAGAGVAGADIAAAQTDGLTDAEILLGQTGVASGPLGTAASALLGGAQLAMDDLNAQGGIHGRRIRLTTLDDQLSPEKAVANYTALLNQHRVFAFFCCVGSGTTAAAANVLAQSGAPMISGFAADSAREKVSGSAYYVRATTGREAQAVLQHLTTIGINRIALATLDNIGGVEVQKLVDTAMAAHKLKLVASVAIKNDGSNTAEAAGALVKA